MLPSLREEIEIFPYRIMGAKTVESLLNEISNLEGIEGVFIHGPSVKSDVREKIVVKGEEAELRVAPSRLIIRVKDADLVMDKLKAICDQILTYGYSIRTGKFTRDQPTLHDYKVLYIMQLRESREDEE